MTSQHIVRISTFYFLVCSFLIPETSSKLIWRQGAFYAIMSEAILFEENFEVTGVAANKYDRVSRLTATGNSGDGTFMTLDVNTELYPCAVGDTLSMCLASTLSLDGSKDEGRSWKDIAKGESTLADSYDYCNFGRVYRFAENSEGESL